MAYSNNPNLPSVRMEAVRLVKSGWSIRKAAKHLGFSHCSVRLWLKRKPVYGWHGKLVIPTFSSRPKHHPKQLKPETIDAIVKQRQKRNRCAEVVHRELLKQGIIVSLSSVKRTLKRQGLIRYRSPWKRWHFSESRPEAVLAGDLVQIDTIHFVIGDKRFYVYTLLDVASRWAYAKTSLRINTWNSLKFVKEALKYAGFNFKMIQSDHGSEFSVWFTEHLGKLSISHRHIRVRKSNDNGHIERFNRTIQEECLNKVNRNLKSFQKAINEYLPYYNNQRLHLGINYLTPLEWLKAIG
ncbi:DDE-type integrase/transposase/recombinase [Patescibacteria group bacterium]|nr:DDE-type integrase/transposase/recombinase [Patescibacteria group bacterium]MBU4458649.1 DDE-type integrase/transposase/recombinase [Patescibacteria group bacterium]MCG2696008.1 integrase core domain-containing protein [Candidatus Portnoybacteria bacterium]